MGFVVTFDPYRGVAAATQGFGWITDYKDTVELIDQACSCAVIGLGNFIILDGSGHWIG